jgi:TolB-like protein/Flp pilus assembly protein TadD
LRLKTFGALALIADDGRADEAKIQRRQLAVLAALAAAGAAGMTRDRLLGLFWPEREQDRARGLLNQALHVARRAIHDDVITEGQSALHLNADLLPSDVVDFTAALDRDDPDAAVAVYGGPFLDAVYLANAPEFERWTSARRESLSDAYVDARMRLAAAAASTRDHARAIAHLRLAAASAPLSATVSHALMLAHAHAGDVSAALNAGRVHAALVREELDADADPSIIALMEDLRANRIQPQPAEHQEIPEPALPRTGEFLAATAPSIAVLPFANLSGGPGDDFFADGMTEEIINVLMRMRRLRVVARTTVFVFKGKCEDVRAIGRRLGVSTVLEGSVQRAGVRLRISARLIRVDDGSHLWLGTFDAEVGDVFAIQDEIAQSIAHALHLSLFGEGIAPRTSVGREAYELYLRGRYLQDKRSPSSLGRAVRAFRDALALEPDYALAHAGLADTFSMLVAYGAVAPRDAMPKLRESAMRAIALDPTLAEPHAALASLAAMYDWDWSAAEAEFKRTLAINPQYQRAHMWYANYCLAPLGRLDEALAELGRAHTLDLMSPVINTCTGMGLYFARRFDDAVSTLREVLELDPHFVLAHYFLGRTEIERGQFGAAIDSLERAVAMTEAHPVALSALAYAHARAGDAAEARALLQRIESLAATSYVSAYDLALVHAGLGDVEPAIVGFQKAFDERSPFMAWLAVQPGFDEIRRDPRIQEILGKMGLRAVAVAG